MMSVPTSSMAGAGRRCPVCRRRLAIAPLAAALLLTAGCPDPKQSLVLTSDTQQIAADGTTVVAISADVVFRNAAIADGKKILFSASDPVLFESLDDIAPDVEGGRREGSSEVDVSSIGGKGRVFLQAPTRAGEIAVQASFTTLERNVLTDSVAIHVGAPPLVAAGAGTTSAGSDRRFDFDCDHRNIGAFVAERAEIRINCTLVLRDVDGDSLPHTPVRFFAEAGMIRDEAANDGSPRKITYVVPPSASPPADVAPAEAEVARNLVSTGEGLIPGAVEQNPRDGLVTLLAVVWGHEAFDDANHNGTWDDGEYFVDEGEPFLDVDDDGVYTPGVDPSPCCDSNGNGQVDGPNGTWDRDVWIGRTTHVLWTGRVDTTARSSIRLVAGDNSSTWYIPAGASSSYRLWISDANYNPVATHDANDELTIDLSTTKAAVTPGSLEAGVPLTNTAGMLLTNEFPSFCFGCGVAVFNGFIVGEGDSANLLIAREWLFTLADRRDPGASSICQQLNWTAEVEVRHQPAPSYSGGSFADLTATLTAVGTLQPQDPAVPPCDQ